MSKLTKTETAREKKQLFEAVARVREVVHGVANEKIALTLQCCDLDVDRTIQAFYEDGAQSVLNSWTTFESPGKTKRRNKKKADLSNASETTNQINMKNIETSGQKVSKKLGDSVSKATNLVERAVHNDAKTIEASPPKAVPSAAVESTTDTAMSKSKKKRLKRKKASATASASDQAVVGSITDVNVPLTNVTTVQTVDKSVSTNSTANTVGTSVAKAKVVNVDKQLLQLLDRVKKTVNQMDQTNNSFNNTVKSAEKNLMGSFKMIEKLMDDRKKHLLYELNRCSEEGNRMIKGRESVALQLCDRAQHMLVMNENEKIELYEEVTRFLAEGLSEKKLEQTTLFSYDTDELFQIIKNFGKVQTMKSITSGELMPNIAVSMPAATAVQKVERNMPTNASYDAFGGEAIKNSTSQSSIVSSLGEDSGLGQISPVANDIAAQGKKVTNSSDSAASNTAIAVTSDAFSPEQLKSLQQNLEQTLKAQGIDNALLSGIGGARSMPKPTRRRPQNTPRGGGRGNISNAPRAPPARMPDLSIFRT